MKAVRNPTVSDAARELRDEPRSLPDKDRVSMIAEAAYFRAERRGFQGGVDEATTDWLEAEAEIDALLAQRSLMSQGSIESAARPTVGA